MVLKSIKAKQNNLKKMQLHYVWAVFQNIFSVDDMKKTGICFLNVLIRELMTIYDCHYLLL